MDFFLFKVFFFSSLRITCTLFLIYTETYDKYIVVVQKCVCKMLATLVVFVPMVVETAITAVPSYMMSHMATLHSRPLPLRMSYFHDRLSKFLALFHVEKNALY